MSVQLGCPCALIAAFLCIWRLGSMCSGFRPVLRCVWPWGSLQRLVLFRGPHGRAQASEKSMSAPHPADRAPRTHACAHTHTHNTSLPRDQVPRDVNNALCAALPSLSPPTQPWGQLGCVMASGGSCSGDRMTLICSRAAAGASGAGSALTQLVTHQLPTPPRLPAQLPGCSSLAPSSREAVLGSPQCP